MHSCAHGLRVVWLPERQVCLLFKAATLAKMDSSQFCWQQRFLLVQSCLALGSLGSLECFG